MQRQLVHDFHEMFNFVENYLPDLAGDEVYFMSLSARNKYLTPEERIEFHLGRTEMFSRTVVRSKEKFFPAMGRYNCDYNGYLTKNGKAIPQKCVVCYVNINPSSATKATQEVMTEIQKRVFDSVLSDGQVPETVASLRKLDVIVLNAFQRQRGTRHLIDIDFDIPKTQESAAVLDSCIKEFRDRGMRFFVVDTRGGYHVVVDKKSISFNYPFLLLEMEKEFEAITTEKVEVIANKNEMIPFPGTLQAGYPVSIRENLSNWRDV